MVPRYQIQPPSLTMVFPLSKRLMFEDILRLVFFPHVFKKIWWELKWIVWSPLDQNL